MDLGPALLLITLVVVLLASALLGLAAVTAYKIAQLIYRPVDPRREPPPVAGKRGLTGMVEAALSADRRAWYDEQREAGRSDEAIEAEERDQTVDVFAEGRRR